MKLTLLALITFATGLIGGAFVNVAFPPMVPRVAGGNSAMNPELHAQVDDLKRRLAVIERELARDEAPLVPIPETQANLVDCAKHIEPAAASADDDPAVRRYTNLVSREFDPVENAWRGELGAWLTRVIVTGEIEARRAAIARLVELGGDDATEGILAALSDSDPHVRALAARYFATGYHEPTAVRSLVKLLDDPAPQVAEWAARALGKVSGERADHDALLLIASMERYYLRSQRAANAFAVGCELQRLGRLDAVAGGMSRWRMLLNAPDAETRRIAVTAVGRFGGVADTACVRPLLQDPDEDVRDEACGALDRLQRRAAPGQR